MEVPECNVCHVALDEDEHQPRHLGCSHDACTTCIKALIKNYSLECPMCRTVVKAYTHEDFLINHGVCQVLRLFKGFKVSENKQKEEGLTSNIKEVCRIHECTADKRCTSCKVWICVYCIDFHTTDIGCEIQEYSEFLMKEKKKHADQVKPTLVSVRKKITLLSSELSDTESEKKKIEEKIEHLQKAIQDGTNTLNKFVAATSTVNKAGTTKELNESVNISNGWHQFAQIWCKKISHTIPNFLQLEVMQKQVLHGPTLIFLEITIGGSPKGRVTMQLNNELPNIKEYMINIVTNKFRTSLSGVHLNFCGLSFLSNHSLPFEGIPAIIPDSNGKYDAKRGDVAGNFKNGFKALCFTIVDFKYKNSVVFGTIVRGLDILDECQTNHSCGVSITACGLA